MLPHPAGLKSGDLLFILPICRSAGPVGMRIVHEAEMMAYYCSNQGIGDPKSHCGKQFQMCLLLAHPEKGHFSSPTEVARHTGDPRPGELNGVIIQS